MDTHLTPEEESRLEAIEARAQKATAGPWGWFGYGGKTRELYLATLSRGRLLIMDFVRWGTQRAQPRFRGPDNIMVEASATLKYTHEDSTQIVGIDNPDAEFIEHSHEDMTFVLGLIQRLRRLINGQTKELFKACDFAYKGGVKYGRQGDQAGPAATEAPETPWVPGTIDHEDYEEQALFLMRGKTSVQVARDFTDPEALTLAVGARNAFLALEHVVHQVEPGFVFLLAEAINDLLPHVELKSGKAGEAASRIYRLLSQIQPAAELAKLGVPGHE